MELYALSKMLCKEYNAHLFAVLFAALVVYFLILLRLQKIFFEIMQAQAKAQAANDVRFVVIEKDVKSQGETITDHGTRIFHLEDKYRNRKNGRKEKRASAGTR